MRLFKSGGNFSLKSKPFPVTHIHSCSMERWVPLFQIFLNSPSPEGDASLWFQNPPSHSQHPTSSFLSLLQTPTHLLQLHHSTPTNTPPLIWIQTLPPTIQSRILSFLTTDRRRFSRLHIRSLAAHILRSDAPGFWVRRAARNLFDAVSSSDPDSFELVLEKNEQEQEFCALPDWLRDLSDSSDPVLPWLPLSPSQLLKRTKNSDVAFSNKHERVDLVTEEERAHEYFESQFSSSPPPSPLDPRIHDKACALKAELVNPDSTSEALRLSREVRQLCLESGAGKCTTVLGLIEPWEVDDEMASVLLSDLSGENSLGFPDWPVYVLCSIVLPKLLILRDPASRVLLSATIGFCKLYPMAAVEALLFPLVLRKEGINVVLCDVLTRIVKECLHPSHVSAFCQRLLCGEEKDRKFGCLPCHQNLISYDLVWTEPLFTLLQHIMNQDVYLTPDTTDQLVSVIVGMAGKFSKSLKFGNFLLCFVTKCLHASKFHKLALMRAAEMTETFVTKSILSKLNGL